MARRRRPGPRTSVVDGRAEIVIPVESIETADGGPMSFTAARRWLARASRHPGVLEPAPRASLTIDRFLYDLHLGDVAHQCDTHDGDAFLDAAIEHGQVAVLVVDGVDPRRCTADEVDAAARSGRVIGGLVTAFAVDAVEG